MNKNWGRPASEWRNQHLVLPLYSISLRINDLKRLYRIIQAKQDELRDYYLNALQPNEGETGEDFQERRVRVSNSFVTSVTVNGFDASHLTKNNEDIFDSESLPEQIKSIFFSTESAPRFILNFIPARKIIVFLDFSRPPIFDLNRLPTFETQNESNFSVDSDDEGWFSSSVANLNDFFQFRRSRQNWLHKAGIYDFLLFVVGIPFSLWVTFKISIFVEPRNLQRILADTMYVYTFLLGISIFRYAFSYIRWLFPKVEIAEQAASNFHRTVSSLIIGGIVMPIAYDMLKYVATILR